MIRFLHANGFRSEVPALYFDTYNKRDGELP